MTPATLRRWLRRATPGRLGALAAVVALPTLGLGFALDDHWLRAHLRRWPRAGPGHEAWWDLFGFYPSPEVTRFHVEQGPAPWWTDPEVRIRFFRPLSSALHLADERLLGGAAWAAHAVSALLYVALCWLVALALRRITPSRLAAALGGVAFVVSAGHAFPLAWISNRNALVGALGAVGALVLHLRAVRGGLPGSAGIAFGDTGLPGSSGKASGDTGLPGSGGIAFGGTAGLPWAALAALSLGAGLTGAEIGLGGLGLVAAVELGLARDGLGRRALRLAPHLVVVVAWAVVYQRFGFGVRGSGLYLDPGGAPLAFLAHLPGRLATLFGALLTGLPADVVAATPQPARTLAVVGYGLGGLAVLALAAPLLRARASTRTFALAAFLPLVPAAGTLPAGRLLLVASVGAAGLLGEVLAHALRRGAGRGRRVGAATLAVFHGPLALLALGGGMAVVPAIEARLQSAARSLDAVEGAATSPCLAVVRGPLFGTAYFAVVRDTLRLQNPAFTLALAPSERPLVVRSEGAALLFEAPEGLYDEGDIALLVRRLDDRFADGARVTHPCGDVTVLASNAAGAPTQFRFDPRGAVTLVTLTDGAFRAFVPPAAGASVRFEAEPPM